MIAEYPRSMARSMTMVGMDLHELHLRLAAEQIGTPDFAQPERQEVVQQISFAHGPEHITIGSTVAQQSPPDLGADQHPDKASGKREQQNGKIGVRDRTHHGSKIHKI